MKKAFLINDSSQDQGTEENFFASNIFEIIKNNFELNLVDSESLTERFVHENRNSYWLIGNFLKRTSAINIIPICCKSSVLIYKKPSELQKQFYLYANPFVKNFLIFKSSLRSLFEKEGILNGKKFELFEPVLCKKFLEVLISEKKQEKEAPYIILDEKTDSGENDKSLNESVKYCKNNEKNFFISGKTSIPNFVSKSSQSCGLVYLPDEEKIYDYRFLFLMLMKKEIITNEYLDASKSEWFSKTPQEIARMCLDNNAKFLNKVLYE